jgi:hypothetical protein
MVSDEVVLYAARTADFVLWTPMAINHWNYLTVIDDVSNELGECDIVGLFQRPI